MTVYLKGINGHHDAVEKHVKSVETNDKYIKIKYDENAGYYSKWCIVSGVEYFKNEMEIVKVEQ